MTSCYLCIQVLDETCDKPVCSLVRLLEKDLILVMVLPSSQKRSTLLQVSSEEQKVSITLPHFQLLSPLYTFLHFIEQELYWQLCKQTSSIERKVLKARSGYERALQSWSEEPRVMMQEMQDRMGQDRTGKDAPAARGEPAEQTSRAEFKVYREISWYDVWGPQVTPTYPTDRSTSPSIQFISPIQISSSTPGSSSQPVSTPKFPQSENPRRSVWVHFTKITVY